jgi:hypothetical protein
MEKNKSAEKIAARRHIAASRRLFSKSRFSVRFSLFMSPPPLFYVANGLS